MSFSEKKPTMKDVAREAGVALGTVSNVFNNVPVGREYKQKVEAAARRLGYSVNSYARGLRAERTYTVAVILPNLVNMFFARLADEICQGLARRGYRMLLATTQYDAQAETRVIQMLRQNMVDGIIGLTYSAAQPDVEGMPYVSIDRVLSPTIPCVASDNYGGGMMAAERLIALGCRRLLFLRIGSTVIGETDKRGGGFAAACGQHSVDCTQKRFMDEGGMEPLFHFLADSVNAEGCLAYDGIFCSTDVLAHQVVAFLRRRGIRVPEDVQVIGYDGTRAFFTEEYACSTIVQPVKQIAETSVDILVNWHQARPSALVCLPVFYAPGGTTKEEVVPGGQ